MAEVTRIGNTDSTANAYPYSSSNSVLLFTKFVALSTGQIDWMGFYKWYGQGLKGAIYSDNAGEPDDLLAYTEFGLNLGYNTWTRLPLNVHVSLVSGTSYWLAVMWHYDAGLANTPRASISRYTVYSGTNPFPVQAPSISGSASYFSSYTPMVIGYNITGYTDSYTVPLCALSAVPQVMSYGQGNVGYGHSLVSVKENVTASRGASTLDITFNNYDGFFDNVGIGQLDTLAVGSRINLFLGYDIKSVDPSTGSFIGKEYNTDNDCSRYFVDSWGYTRAPNFSTFTIHCIDAWGLLEKYKFNRKVSFNYAGATTTYSVYEIIEMLCKAIGGGLDYINRSSYITTFKPVVEVNAGENAANLLRRLLNLVSDEIRFWGNNGYIVYPQTTDVSTYLLKFPVN